MIKKLTVERIGLIVTIVSGIYIPIAIHNNWFPFGEKEKPSISIEPRESIEPDGISMEESAEQVEHNVERTIEKSFILFGVWGSSTKGDNEMDTNDGDVVPVLCRTELSFTPSEVIVRIRYRIVEDGGDRTTFDDTIIKTVFNVGANQGRILDIKTSGSVNCEFNDTSEGSNHNIKFFRTDGTYWEHLKYKVDSRGPDNNEIGVEGKLRITIITER